jgi:hypothetical protein
MKDCFSDVLGLERASLAGTTDEVRRGGETTWSGGHASSRPVRWRRGRWTTMPATRPC